MRQSLGLACLIAATALTPQLSYAQGAELGGKASANEAQEGLESATPTDDVSELNSGLNSSDHGSSNSNHSPAEDDPSSFDVNAAPGKSGNAKAGGNADGNGTLFDVDAPNAAGAKGGPATNAFGNGTNAGAASNANANANAAGKSAKNAPATNAPVNAPTNVAPGNTAPVDATPANAAPVNPQSGVPTNVQTNAPTNAPSNAAADAAAKALFNTTPPGDAAPPVAAVPPVAATGQEDLVAKPAEAPPIEALPLPPPNDFAGAPPVPGTMRLMAEGEAPEEYLVEPGDSLYDICDQLLDEAGYWPKLWALNPEIKNPHFIFPNMRLRFYPGDDETPPYLQVVTEDDVIPIDKGTLQEEQLIAEKVVFAPEEQAAADPVVEVIGPEGVEPLQDEILTAGRLYDGHELEVHVPGFIYHNEREPLGKVLGGRAGDIAAPPDAEVDVVAEAGLAPGSLLTILRQADDAKSPATGSFIGYRYYYVANIRIARALADNVYRGKIQDGRLPVKQDDLVVTYISTKRSIPLGDVVGALRPTPALVVAWEFPDQEIGGAGNYAFIDKGSADGVSPGMYLPFYSSPDFLSLAAGSMDLPVDYELAGAMRIIDVTDAASVGYVVRNSIEIKIGDRTNQGKKE